MSSKRDLKRAINAICQNLCIECSTALFEREEVKQNDIEDVITSILKINSSFIRRISHVEPGMTPKEYYKRLVTDFNKEVDAIINRVTTI